MNLFGKKQTIAPVVPKESTVDTIKSLRVQLDTLEKREIHIGKKVDMTLAEATQKARAHDKRGQNIGTFILNLLFFIFTLNSLQRKIALMTSDIL
jgi:hypothetical protein